MELKPITYSSVIVAFICAAACLDALSADQYTPPLTFQKTVLTYTIHKDGSYVGLNELSRRIETEIGASSLGDVDIPYIPQLESLEILDAYTVLPNGSHIKVPKKNIRTTNDELDRGGATYSDTKHKIIIFPNVVVGSQLYYKYKKVVHTPVFPGQFAKIQFMSPHFKFEHFEVNFNFDPKIDIKFDSRGFEGGVLPDKNGMHRYSYIFKQNRFLPTETNQIKFKDDAPFVQASTYKNYESLGNYYQKKAKTKVRVTPAIQNLASELTKNVDEKRTQARILYNWVAKNIRYVGSYIGNGGFVPHDSQTILDNKWGDCKDHVVILEALLAAKGIESSPALINTEKSYVLPKLTADVFNHVITYIPSLDMYLDSTDQFSPFGVLPVSDLNKQVILTGLNRMGKTPPMKADENKVTTLILLNVLPDGAIQGSSHTTSSGEGERNHRYTQFDYRNESQEKVTNAILESNNLTGVGQLYSSDPTNLDKPLEITSTFTLDPISKFPGPGAMFIPAGLSFGVIDKNMQRKPKVNYVFPEYCESFSYSNHFKIEYPLSIKIINIPDNVSYIDESTRYIATYVLKGNILDINRDLVNQHPSMVCGEATLERDKKFFPVFQRDMLAQVIYE